MADEKKAAFGVFPQMKPRRSRQDREAAKNVPVDIARGFAAGALGMPGDVESLIRLLPGFDEETVLPTSKEILEKIPFGSDTPASRAAAELGILGGGVYTGPGSAARAITAVPRAIKRAGKDFAMAAGETGSRIFIGPKAKTWDKAAADAAERMEKAGVDPVDIWRQTGTFRGADGILRQEIDDRAAAFLTPDERKEIAAVTKAGIDVLKEKIKPTPQKDLFPKKLSEAKQTVRERIANAKQELADYQKDPSVSGAKAYTVFSHPELYRAYPELKDIPIETGGYGGQGTRGSLSIIPSDVNKPGAMSLDIYDPGLKSGPTSTSLHEMQHAVQTLEKMGPGGSPTMAFQDPRAFEILKRMREEINQPVSFEQFQLINKYPESEAQEAYAKYVKEKAENPIIPPSIDRDLQKQAAMEYYKRLAGEAEARATQAREPMGPTQRRQEFPYSSYDVLPEDLIVKDPKPFAHGGKVRFSDNPDTMRLELSAGGIARIFKGAATPKKAAVPIDIPRVRPTKEQIEEAANRVAWQQMGQHVIKPGKTENLAGRSVKEVKRLRELPYKVTPTKELPVSKPYEPKVGEVNIALPGDQTIADMILESIEDLPIYSLQQGGAKYGLGKLADPEEFRAFWASNQGAAQNFQNKVDEIARQFGTDKVNAYHLAMGTDSNNFAQHFADANLRAIDFSKLSKRDMEIFDSHIAAGFKDQKTGQYLTFPEWPGIANPEAALAAMKENSNLRKWFNNRMKTRDLTSATNMPDGRSIQWAITEPLIRDAEINLTGLSVGRMKPEARLIPGAQHETYSHDIAGTFMGHAPELAPFEISFPDVTSFVRGKYNPKDFTGTIQKVFPHQVVDEAYLEDMARYYERLRQIRGFKEGGEVDGAEMAAGGAAAKTMMEALAKLKLLREEAAAKAAQQAQYAKEMEGVATRDMPTFDQWKAMQENKGYASGGEITADDLIIEERPL